MGRRSSGYKIADSASEYSETKSRLSQSQGTRKKRGNRGGTIDSRFNEENLGDNFEETPWLPPSIAKAILFKETAIIRQGT